MLLAQVVLAETVPARLVVGALALGNTIGVTLAAVPLVIIVRRIRGHDVMKGVIRATVVGLLAAAVGAGVGVAVSIALPVDHKLLYALVATVASCCAVAAFCAVAFLLDDGDLRVVLGRVRQIVRPRSARQTEATDEPALLHADGVGTE